MLSSVRSSLVVTAALLSTAQGIHILKPASGETVDASQGLDIVWTYDSSDYTNWEIELANPQPGKLIATGVTQVPISGTATSTFSYHVAAFTGVADGGNYHVVLDPRNGGTGAFPESGAFTIVNGQGGAGSTTTTSAPTSTATSAASSGMSSTSASSATQTSITSIPSMSQTTTTGGGSTTVTSSSSSSPVTASSSPASTTARSSSAPVTSVPSSVTIVPPFSSATGRNSTITTASTKFSTYVSGSMTSLIPQSTVIETTVVPGAAATTTGTGASSSPTVALAAGGISVSRTGLLGSVLGAVLGLFML